MLYISTPVTGNVISTKGFAMRENVVNIVVAIATCIGLVIGHFVYQYHWHHDYTGAVASSFDHAFGIVSFLLILCFLKKKEVERQ